MVSEAGFLRTPLVLLLALAGQGDGHHTFDQGPRRLVLSVTSNCECAFRRSKLTKRRKSWPGVNETYVRKSGRAPTLTDDAAIASQIQFVLGPAGSTYGDAVRIDGTVSNNGKSSFSVLNTSFGFAAGPKLLLALYRTYETFKERTASRSTLAFQLGIQLSDWSASQAGFTAQRSDESA